MKHWMITFTIFFIMWVGIACGDDQATQSEDTEEQNTAVTDPSIKPVGEKAVYTITSDDADVVGPDHMYLYANGYIVYMTGLSDTEEDTHFVHAFGGNYTLENGILTITLDKKASVLQQGHMNASENLEPIPGNKWVSYQFTYEELENGFRLSNKQELQRALIPHLNIKEGDYIEGELREP